MQFSEIEQGVDAIQQRPDELVDAVDQLLHYGEAILENWLIAHQLRPTQEKREGYRLLALHRQGAQREPSFHACRESCRELIYQINLYHINQDPQQITMAALVAKHLLLFIRGKMEIQELGEFCCNSKAIST